MQSWPTIQSMMSQKCVGIAGAGGLGSNIAAALVRTGIGKLVICDYDRVDQSNLNRQFYFQDQIGRLKVDVLKENLLRINPSAGIETWMVRLEPANIRLIFQDIDLLIEAFDQAAEKTMLIETALTEWPSRPIIVGSGMAGYGHSETIHVRSSGSLYLCGDESTGIGPESPPLAPRVGIVAHLMANLATELLLKDN